MKTINFGPYSMGLPEHVTIDQTPKFIGPQKMLQGKLVLNVDNNGTQAVVTPPVMQMPGMEDDTCAVAWQGSDHPLCSEEPNMFTTLPEISKLIKDNFSRG